MSLTLAMREALVHARRVARGRIHDDELRSEAGYAVTLAINDPSPGKSGFATYVARLVRWGVLRLLRDQQRFENRGDVYWAALQSRNDSASACAEMNEAERLVLQGATVPTIQEATGLSERRAKRFRNEVRLRHEGKTREAERRDEPTGAAVPETTE